ncbi:MAG: bifunctional diaminohydroxyphosphoribosylaminopyrimidine deaminase/5-amino-6-(5-phosphoribosylamino)uracil reductase RibD [Deltaproteobacteria bacterium]|nr:bifunctional diaminohydroxyphosphoribosylaminopyrimidine deaminase/5-amino-6-(5-phosphoribosylamino)uracil reductase RibD [Deltaproteobacteria bacterium]
MRIGKEFRIPPVAEQFMRRALRLARRGLGRTAPNPMVGAVVVKAGRVIGEGYHSAVGQPHAEIEALTQAGPQARDAELFVTLEPCNHHGRTPPCTRAIIEAGVKKVWYGMQDLNPDVEGGGGAFLRASGVEVVGRVLEDQCRLLNEVYVINVTLRRPFVYLKLAMSLDGRIATRTGESKWITSEASRRQVHALRDRVSAVMVGIGTVTADNPGLTTRLPRKRGRDAIRIVVDSNLRTPPDAAVFNPASDAGVIIACRKDAPAENAILLEERGAQIVRTRGRDRVDIADLMHTLYRRGISSVLVEGGASLAWSVLEAKVTDRCLFYYAPIIIGGADAPAGVGGKGVRRLPEAPRMEKAQISRVGPDILVSGRIAYPVVNRSVPGKTRTPKPRTRGNRGNTP